MERKINFLFSIGQTNFLLLYLRGCKYYAKMIKKLLQLLVLLTGMLAGAILMYVFAIASLMLVHACTFDRAMVYLTQAGGVRFLQALQTIFLFVLPVFFMLRIFKQDSRRFLSLRKVSVNKLLLAVLSILLMMPLMNLIISWNEQMHLPQAWASMEAWMRRQEMAATQLTELMMSDVSWRGLLLNLLVMALMTAFGEECFFRGTLQTMLKSETDKMPHAAIWVTAFIFSAIHLQFYGFFPRLLMGAWLGYLLCWTGSLWVPVVAHAFNNAMVVFSYYALDKQWIPENFGETIGTGNTWYLAVVSALSMLILALHLSDSQFSFKQLFSKRG